MIRKKEGFEGQQSIVLPRVAISNCMAHELVKQLYVTDIGYYPKARFHYRQRTHGVSQYILIYCIEGKGWLQLGGEKWAVRPNEFLLIPAREPHVYGADQEHPWTIYWMHFTGLLSNHFAGLLTQGHRRHVQALPYREDRIRLFDLMYQHLERGYGTDNMTFVNLCLWQWLNSFAFGDKLEPVGNAPKDAVDESISYMKNNIHRTLRLADIAACVHLSASHYSNLFRKRTGFAPIEYFNLLKIQVACQYLQFTNLRIQEIAGKIGIEDPYYFSRLFSHIMGMSPNAYRKRKMMKEGGSVGS
ncbi:AraC family transcriptional regulator [Chitinophaga japonensis]|uniref:AraC-like DNA-binding protein n=1 Tax=Chitinophaga japonensis TaxID=104662 RepID=A0A562SN99_CHIJA|nr:AraC family transcriptional regulator [Chitinophaga japonensis]TWI82668.1 AraC-like DNA-binding protein [Chitinophaga japonensis]